MFDMMRFLFGEVESLHAIGSTHEYNEVDDFSVLLKFASGMHATLATAADASWLFPFERVEVFCHHATLVTREMESLTCSTTSRVTSRNRRCSSCRAKRSGVTCRRIARSSTRLLTDPHRS
jgi:predicted dehydrogenase